MGKKVVTVSKISNKKDDRFIPILGLAILGVGILIGLLMLLTPGVRSDPNQLNLVTNLLIRERRGFLSLVDDFLHQHPEFSIQILSTTGEYHREADLYLGSPTQFMLHPSRWAERTKLGVGGTNEMVPRFGEPGLRVEPVALRESLDQSFLPLIWSPYGLFINRQVLLDGGFSVPSDWDQLVQLIAQVFNRPRPISLAIAGPMANRRAMMEWLIDTRTLQSPRGVSASNQLDSWIQNGYILPLEQEVEDADLALLLADGRVAMVLGPLHFYGNLDPDQTRAVGFIPLPGTPGLRPALAARVVGGAVVSGSESKPVVKEFLQFLLDPRNQEQWVSRSGNRITFNSLHRNARFPNEEGFQIAQLSRIMDRLWLE